MKKKIFLGILICLWACQEQAPEIVVKKGNLALPEQHDYPVQLSDWRLFKTPIKNLIAAESVIPYELASPLFTDYAQKSRFIKLPKDSVALYNKEEVLDFPIGTIIIKNFYYTEAQIGEHRILETRLLVHEEEAWKALSYVWNEEQTDAKRTLSGASIPLKLIQGEGELKEFSYSVPNEVQCKSCHEYKGKMSPIGPKARQLNHKMAYGFELQNQLEYWHEKGLLSDWPGLANSPSMVNYHDPSQNLNLRARAYLDINCAHCHRREGPAKNSGLYLTYLEADPYKLGFNKPPVAAGRGSGGMKYALVKGQPEQSILYHRMASLDPGVMMPELGRKLNHEEGLALIADWIKQSKEI